MSKHLKSAKHEREMVGRENIEVVDHYEYNQEIINIHIYNVEKYIIYTHTYVCVYVIRETEDT
jgi:hypothetical protein